MTAKGDWSASLDVLGQFFYIIFILGIVILLFLISMRWFAAMRGGRRGRNIRVIESCGVSPQSSVQILQAGGRLFLIGVTKEHISYLTEITGEAIDTAANPNARLFEQFLKKTESGSQPNKREDEA